MSAVSDRLTLLRRKAGRWGTGPLVVRLLLFAAAVATLALGMPSPWIVSRFTIGIIAGAALVAVAPRGRFVTTILVIAALAWLASTTVFSENVVVWRLVALACAMYLVHTLAALAAVLPYDAVLPPGVVGAWLFRAAITLAVSAGLGIFAMVEAPLVVGPVYVMASVGGTIVAGTLVWVLTRSARR